MAEEQQITTSMSKIPSSFMTFLNLGPYFTGVLKFMHMAVFRPLNRFIWEMLPWCSDWKDTCEKHLLRLGLMFKCLVDAVTEDTMLVLSKGIFSIPQLQRELHNLRGFMRWYVHVAFGLCLNIVCFLILTYTWRSPLWNVPLLLPKLFMLSEKVCSMG